MRAEALAIAATDGAEAASLATSVPSSTIRSWQRRASLSAERLIGVVVSASEPWSERRPKLAQAFAVGAHEAVVAAQAAIADGRARDSRDLSVSAGILTDKCLLLAGQATSRSESLNWSGRVVPPDAGLGTTEDIEQEIAELRAEAERLGLDPDDDSDDSDE